MSDKRWKPSKGVMVVNSLKDDLKEPYQIFMALPKEEQMNISAGMQMLMDRCPQMGVRMAFELVYKLGLFLANGGRVQ